ncbi:hypothetical protein L596_024561 [Steinernema carpocapsae]|uniref:SXP/RAL-2 family protein Ani s 5-like cation-binding domain-containing protein n=1 Tax=Steinernema carpocapsae TaxID=34508 RepID=A0A4U5MH45_STECR|nr:hypothetical protein L596_024561 [Steinernema carpocapsae]
MLRSIALFAIVALVAPVAGDESTGGLLGAVSPLVDAASPVLGAVQPVVDAANPVVQAVSPVLEAIAPLLAAIKPVVEALGPLVKVDQALTLGGSQICCFRPCLLFLTSFLLALWTSSMLSLDSLRQETSRAPKDYPDF